MSLYSQIRLSPCLYQRSCFFAAAGNQCRKLSLHYTKNQQIKWMEGSIPSHSPRRTQPKGATAKPCSLGCFLPLYRFDKGFFTFSIKIILFFSFRIKKAANKKNTFNFFCSSFFKEESCKYTKEA